MMAGNHLQMIMVKLLEDILVCVTTLLIVFLILARWIHILDLCEGEKTVEDMSNDLLYQNLTQAFQLLLMMIEKRFDMMTHKNQQKMKGIVELFIAQCLEQKTIESEVNLKVLLNILLIQKIHII